MTYVYDPAVHRTRIRCVGCGEFAQPGQKMSFAYSQHRHVMCPVHDEAGACGEVHSFRGYEWAPINLPEVEGAVMVCVEHCALAPGFVYDA